VRVENKKGKRPKVAKDGEGDTNGDGPSKGVPGNSKGAGKNRTTVLLGRKGGGEGRTGQSPRVV